MNPHPLNDLMTDTQIAALDERIRIMETTLFQLREQRTSAIKAKFLWLKLMRNNKSQEGRFDSGYLIHLAQHLG